MTLAQRLMYEPTPTLRALLLAAASAVILVVIVNALLYPRAPESPDVVSLIATIAPAADAGSIATTDDSFAGGGAGGCPASVRHGSSTLEICWQAYRLLNEEDGNQDYYGLEISATIHAEAAGARWAVVQVHPLAGSAWPGEGEQVALAPGACQYVGLRAGPVGPARSVLACEQWNSGSVTREDQQDDARTTWNCGLCLSGMVGNRDLPLVQWVTVSAGVVPSWQLSADFGG